MPSPGVAGSGDTLMDCANTAIARQNQPAAIAPLRKCFILFSFRGPLLPSERTSATCAQSGISGNREPRRWVCGMSAARDATWVTLGQFALMLAGMRAGDRLCHGLALHRGSSLGTGNGERNGAAGQPASKGPERPLKLRSRIWAAASGQGAGLTR